MSLSTKMAYESAEELVFGTAKNPVKYGFDLEVGGGCVYPELVPHPRPKAASSKKEIVKEYKKMITDVLDVTVGLGFPGIQIELEHVSQMTSNPDWGAEVSAQTKALLEKYYNQYGLKGAIRSTIADHREPLQEDIRNGKHMEYMLEAFDACAKNGTDGLSIESIGGKEISDHCIVREDIRGVLFGIGVLGSKDMEYIWSKIVDIANKNGVVPAGDTDCSQANVAMFMSGGYHGKSVSHVFATFARAISAARTLVAHEQGAQGPTKDCAYESPIIKAITGDPITTEGKASACAHSDLMGNLIAAVTDLWSNEAVEYQDMFAGSSVKVFAEILSYDTALMNTSIEAGQAKILRDLMVHSDLYRDPQAFILAPHNAYEIGSAIVENSSSYYERARAAALKAGELMAADDNLRLSQAENDMLKTTMEELESFPEKEEDFIDECVDHYKEIITDFKPENYGL